MLGSTQSASSFLANVSNKTDGYVLTADSGSPGGVTWMAGGGGGGGGVTTVGSYGSQSPVANGAVITGSFIYFQSASLTVPGMVSTGTQSFAGQKTFGGAILLGSSLQINTNLISSNYAIS